MKKILISLVVVMSLALSSCSVNSSEIDNFDTNKISYYKDVRTGICYAVVASRKTGDMSESGLGMTVVPCDKVEKYLKK